MFKELVHGVNHSIASHLPCFINTSSLPVPETKFNRPEGERLGQIVVTPEVVASKINNTRQFTRAIRTASKPMQN